MKLSTLVKEDAASSGIKLIASTSPAFAASLSSALAELSKKYKFVGEKEDTANSRITFEYSNGLVKILVIVIFSEANKKPAALYARATVNEKYLLNIDGFKNGNSLVSGNVLPVSSERDIADIVEAIQAVAKIGEEFSDWYFDMSGTFGKVKLARVETNPFGNNASGAQRFVAVAGEFVCATDDGSADHPKNIETEKRVFD
jgi:hypothetical protein